MPPELQLQFKELEEEGDIEGGGDDAIVLPLSEQAGKL
jgi:hypothetical protein